MSTVTYTNATYAPAPTHTERAPRVLRRFFNALIEARQRRAEREIARYLASHGGLLTDGMEREIMQRLTGNSSKAV